MIKMISLCLKIQHKQRLVEDKSNQVGQAQLKSQILEAQVNQISCQLGLLVRLRKTKKRRRFKVFQNRNQELRLILYLKANNKKR